MQPNHPQPQNESSSAAVGKTSSPQPPTPSPSPPTPTPADIPLYIRQLDYIWEGPSDHKRRDDPDELIISAYANLQLRLWRSLTKTEVSCVGLAHPNDPLYITSFILVPQVSTATTTAFCEEEYDNISSCLTSKQIPPCRYAGYWTHTHPSGMGPNPSSVDEDTYSKPFIQRPPYGMMLILGGNNEWFCRLRLRTEKSPSPLAMSITLPVRVEETTFPLSGIPIAFFTELLHSAIKAPPPPLS